MTRSNNTASNPSDPDVVLIGAGIMNAPLVVILKELDSKLKIEIHEVLGSEAQEIPADFSLRPSACGLEVNSPTSCGPGNAGTRRRM
jgi:Malate:quinone oxidoreductase (Mqo)